MTAKFQRDGLHLTAGLLQYVRDVFVEETAVQIKVREETALLPEARMMISPEQGQLLALLVRLVEAKRVIEVGSFTGYSGLWLLGALGEGGRFVACDVDEAWLGQAQEAWREAGLGEKAEARLGPAAESLRGMLAQGWAGTVDLMFIDADKESYVAYFELGLELVRPGGLLLFDNALWSGRVADPSDKGELTEAIRALNARVGAEPRVFAAMIPIGDGLLAAIKA